MYRRRARPGSEGEGDATPQESRSEGKVTPPHRRLDWKGKVAPPHRKLDGLRALREKGNPKDWLPDGASGSPASSGLLAPRQESESDTDDESSKSPAESPRMPRTDPEAGPSAT